MTKSEQNKLQNLQKYVANKIIGQKKLTESIIVCLLSNGHVLIEGLPGLAKTTAAKAISEGIEGDFRRVQFTPDLLPSDLIGTEIYNHDKGDFSFRQGPIFNNIILADEINRAPAKVQSALLEAMEENQITVGHKTYPLPELYMVLATQNPIEQEGTYNLPEAQMDRFLMHIEVKYPSQEEEFQVINLMELNQKNTTSKNLITTQKELFSARKSCSDIFISDNLKKYAISLIDASRYPAKYDQDLAQWITIGASPRATLAIIKCAKSLAWIRGNDCVTPTHIKDVSHNILRHRISLSFDAQSDEISKNQVIDRILKTVAIP
ncbi:AAA family ATPase [Flavobacteriaceae bacterium]|nr:AAA family ATPase [Flavobacteriaceae bacterium]